jgi:hypothetical protein
VKSFGAIVTQESSSRNLRDPGTFTYPGLALTPSPTTESAPRWHWGHQLGGRTLWSINFGADDWVCRAERFGPVGKIGADGQLSAV